jgi:peptidoglycan/LPS O-acetylase OafA/YrhL
MLIILALSCFRLFCGFFGAVCKVIVSNSIFFTNNWPLVLIMLIFYRSFFVVVIILAVLSTIYDVIYRPTSDSWLRVFSLKYNGQNLLSTKESPGEIKSAHGIRVVALVSTYILHLAVYVPYLYFTNKRDLADQVDQSIPLLIIGNSYLVNSTFFILSGMMTTYSILRSLQRTGKIQFSKEYLGRYLRLID